MEHQTFVPKDVYREFRARLPGSRILVSEPMSNHTSFRIGGPCDLLVLPSSQDEALAAWSLCRQMGMPCSIIGNATNLLVKDGGIRGCVIKMAPDFSGIEMKSSTVLSVKSGTLLPRIVQAAYRAGLSGLEFAVGIPGSAGGAIAMNAGAYGVEMSSLVVRVEVASDSGEVFWFNPGEAGFSYRHSVFLDRHDLMILSAELALVPGDKDAIYDLMLKRTIERHEKQPLEFPSAGSAFKRPPGRYVGQMVEELGLKGFSVGGAQVSPKHAGFIVNTGNATARDVLTLMEIIRTRVHEAYGVWLEPEIVIIGEDDQPE